MFSNKLILIRTIHRRNLKDFLIKAQRGFLPEKKKPKSAFTCKTKMKILTLLSLTMVPNPISLLTYFSVNCVFNH
jgi:hypothetical protein